MGIKPQIGNVRDRSTPPPAFARSGRRASDRLADQVVDNSQSGNPALPKLARKLSSCVAFLKGMRLAQYARQLSMSRAGYSANSDLARWRNSSA